MKLFTKLNLLMLFIALSSFTANAVTNADAGQDQIICNDSTQLHANSPGSGETGKWYVVSGSGTFVDDTDSATIVYNIGEQTNTYRWVITDGSWVGGTSSDDVDITNNYRTPNAGADDDVCGDTYNLSANDPSPNTGTWSVYIGGGTFNDASSNTATISGLDSGDNYLIWTIHECDGTDASDTVIITNNLIVADAGIDQIVCSDTAQLNANNANPGTGTWSAPLASGVTFDDTHDPNTVARNLPHGTTTLTWEINNSGCISNDDVDINNNSASTSNAGSDQVRCSDQTTLHANNPTYGTGLWSVATGTGTFWNATNRNTNVSNLSFGDNNLVWTISTANCQSTDTVKITNDLLIAYAGEDIASCYDTIQLNANNASPGVGKWTTSTLITFDDNTLYNTIARNLSTNGSKLYWEITYNGCKSKDSVIVRMKNGTPTANAGTDQNLCNNSTTLTATLNTGEQGQWVIVSGFGTYQNINNPTSQVGNLQQGANILRWIVENNGCTDEDDVVITNNLPDAPNAGNNQTLCADNSVLNANTISIGSGQWSIASGNVTFTDNTNPQTAITSIQQGTNQLVWTTTNTSCILRDTVQIINDLPDASNAGTDQTICADNYGPLSANIPLIGIGQWSVISGNGIITDINSNASSVSNLDQGANTLRWTITNNNCTLFDDVIITNDLPDNPFAGYDKTVCTDSTYLSADALNTGTGIWTDTAGNVYFVDNTNPTTFIDSLIQGTNTLVFTAINNACSLSDTVIITNNRPTIPNAGVDSSICSSSYVLSANNPSIGNGEWSIANGNATFANINSNTSALTGLQQGINTLRWTITNNNCALFDDVVITNDLPDNPFAGYDKTVCTDSTYLSADALNIGIGIWTDTAGNVYFADNTNPTTFIDSLVQGTNTLVLTANNNACSLSDTVIITNDRPTIPDAGLDTSICANQYTLAANNPSVGYGEWSVVNGYGTFINVNSDTSDVTGLQQGANILRWTITNNTCSLFDDVVITNDLPDVPNAGADFATCSNQAQLNATNPNIGTGLWTAIDTIITFVDSSLYNAVANNLPQAIDTFVWTLTHNACSLSDTVFVSSSQLTIANTHIDLSCYQSNDGSIDITVDGGFTNYSYEWFNNNGSLNYLTEDVINLVADTFIVTATDANNCKISDTIIVNQPTQIVANTVINNILCHDDSTGSIQVYPSGGVGDYTYSWTVQDSSHYNVTDSTSAHLLNMIAGTYTTIITDSSNCFISETYTLTQPTQISLIADIIDNVCYDGYKGSIDLTVDGGTPAYDGYTYIWTEQNDSIVQNYDSTFIATSEDLQNLHAGTFNIDVTDQNGCKMSGTFKIDEPFQGMEITSEITDVSCKDQHDGAIDLNVEYGTAPYTYNWSNEVISEDLEKLDGGNYTITITDIYGCQLTDSFTVNVNSIECIHVYNAFSPNDDDVNDTWEIDNIYLYPDVVVNVFNQWGVKVFESKGYKTNWDGKFNGKPLPAATYYYTLNLNNGDKPHTGSVTILK